MTGGLLNLFAGISVIFVRLAVEYVNSYILKVLTGRSERACSAKVSAYVLCTRTIDLIEKKNCFCSCVQVI
jgi:hypothetical protein